MALQKLLSLTCILLLGTTPLLAPLTAAHFRSPHATDVGLPTAHLIPGVPYVAQNKMNFCVFACLTMIFNYLRLNTSINELAFYGGVGYIHCVRDGHTPPPRTPL